MVTRCEKKIKQVWYFSLAYHTLACAQDSNARDKK